MRKLGLFFTLIISIFLLGTATNVAAATFDITVNSKVNGYYFPNWWGVASSGSNANRNLTIRYEDWQLFSQSAQFGYASYGYLYLCSTGDFTISSPPTCSTGCFSSNLDIAYVGGNCTAGDSSYGYQNGKTYFIFYGIDSWAWNTEHTLPYYSDTITFHTTESAIRIEFISNTLTDTNYYVDYASNNRINELQQETNNRLNSINSSINNQTSAINNQTSAINNQTSAINNQTSAINNQTSTISDSSISSTSSSSFFSNFSTSDNGGISSVITAPLSFIRAMSSSCSPITFTIFEQEISLPCGTTLFWDKEEVQPFRDVWNVLVGGAFVYMLLRKVFMTIEDMKDPVSDKVSVIKL